MASGAEKIVLYANHLCPFVHRVYITLAELNLDYEEVIIDLNKPREPWYLEEVNPKGKVPVVKVGKHLITESTIITEFLADAFPSNLLPRPTTIDNAAFRARVHFFLDTFNNKIVPLFAKTLYSREPAGSPASLALGDDLYNAFKTEIEPLLHDANPYFGGSGNLTLAEVNAASFLLRIEAFSEQDAPLLPPEMVQKLRQLPNVGKWSEKVRTHKSVAAGIWDKDAIVAATLERLERLRLQEKNKT